MIKPEGKRYKNEILAMWQRNFHDPAPYARFYFDEIYRQNEVLINESDTGELRGMLHLNPYTLHFDGRTVQAHYIVGVATDEEYRRQGVMRELLKETFEELRDRGELFTYLMPADEAYYLPFDFRFGADWMELELEYHPGQTGLPDGQSGQKQSVQKQHDPVETGRNGQGKTQGGLLYFTDHLKDGDAAATSENLAKDQNYYIHTKISAGYFRCLEKESRSDFAKVFYVYDRDRYVGRFVAGSQNDFMILSRVSCCIKEKADFMAEVIAFCEKRYHFGKYQLVLDEAWESFGGQIKKMCGVHVFSIKKKPMIMFRILNLEKTGMYFRSRSEICLRLHIEDRHLPAQSGTYVIECTSDRGRICKEQAAWDKDQTTAYKKQALPRGERMTKDAEPKARIKDTMIPHGGKIAIGDFTAILFGTISQRDIDKLPDLSDDGRQLLGEIIPWRVNCIMEYV